MSSIETEADDNSPLEPAVGRTDNAGPDIGQQVHDFPQDASDEAFGQFLREHHAKKLRAACTQLGLHPQADPSTNHKDGYITLLGQYRRARLRGEVFSGYPRIKSKQKKGPATIEVDGRTKHCGFRLANVLFSPTFFCRMVESGALPSTGLEVDTVDGRAKFWREVAMAFASENPQFDVVVGQSGPYEGIDPRLAPHHSSAKLCAIWKDMTTRYEESLARWKQLGTDKVGFAHFCGDYLDGLYLHDWLQIRPIPLDPEQVRASKRARTGNVQQGNESTTSTGADSDVERRNFLTPHDVEAATQDQTSSTGKTQVPILREFVVNPSAAQARGHRELFTTRHLPTQRRILPRAGPSQTAVQRQKSRNTGRGATAYS
ncbi:hypothetical protein ON010_g14267 [Phytophthora cinnamomi]|nr:hypothetical protein ON010_g14267 [Phytophthora cinnamomi]